MRCRAVSERNRSERCVVLFCMLITSVAVCFFYFTEVAYCCSIRKEELAANFNFTFRFWIHTMMDLSSELTANLCSAERERDEKYVIAPYVGYLNSRPK